MMSGPLRYLLLALLLLSRDASAILTIEITQGAEGALPIAVVPFGWKGSSALPPEDVAGVVTADLAGSGRFNPLPMADMLARPTVGQEVRFRDWRVMGTESLVVGSVTETADGQLEVQFRLFDVFRGEQLIGHSIATTAAQLRRTAHQISDLIYAQLTGQRGAFSTQVAYIVVARSSSTDVRYMLQVADADGHNEQTILDSGRPILSPAWSPDGRRLAYVSFESGRTEIFIQDLMTGQRHRALTDGTQSSAPAWSPDGRQLALASSRDGNREIYVLELASGQYRRLTHNAGIDTEPAWAPDGKSLIFTSDRGGKPQIYRVAVDGGRPQRVTFEGAYNTRASFSPDGRSIVMVHGNDNRYGIAVMELESGLLQVLTDGGLDESPSFAPNGSIIIYATAGHNRGELAAVTVDGGVHQRIRLQAGDARDPAWSPFRN